LDPKGILTAEQKKDSERLKLQYIGEQQLIEDIFELLQYNYSKIQLLY
jgi:hypothetical protein